MEEEIKFKKIYTAFYPQVAGICVVQVKRTSVSATTEERPKGSRLANLSVAKATRATSLKEKREGNRVKMEEKTQEMKRISPIIPF